MRMTIVLVAQQVTVLEPFKKCVGPARITVGKLESLLHILGYFILAHPSQMQHERLCSCLLLLLAMLSLFWRLFRRSFFLTFRFSGALGHLCVSSSII